MKTIKETLIGTMKNGKTILNEIAVSEKVGKDFSLDKTRTQRIVDQLHPAVLNLRISEIIPATKDAKPFVSSAKTDISPRLRPVNISTWRSKSTA